MSLAKNTTYNLIGAIVPLALALITIPIYLNLIGTERYGALAIVWLILGYFGLFDLGLGRATAQRIAALKSGTAQERSDVFWTAVAVNIGMGIVGGIILYFAAQYFFTQVFKIDESLRPEIVAAVPFVAAAVPIATLTGVASGALQGREKFLEVNMVTVVGTSMFQLFPLAVAFSFGPELKWLILAAVIARIAGLLIFLARVHKNLLAGQAPRFDRDQWLGLLKYGGWISVTAAIGPLLVVSDRFVIGAVLSAAAVAIYTVPFEIAQRISLLPRSLGMALFPRMASSDLEEGKRTAERAIFILVLVMTPPILFAMLILQPFLELWVGEEIARQAAPVGWILIAGYWVNAFAIVPYGRLQAIGRPDIVSLALLAQLPIYIGAMVLALQEFGLIGAAAVFSIRCLVDYLLLSWLSVRRFVGGYLMLICGTIVLAILLLLFHIPSFGLEWWAALAMSALAVTILSLSHVPRELRPMLDRVLPAFFLNKLRYC